MKLINKLQLITACALFSQAILSINSTAFTLPSTQVENITFYIDNQITNGDKATVKLISGYVNHPRFENLISGNTVCVPDGNYVLSVTPFDGYEFKGNGQYSLNINSGKNNTFSPSSNGSTNETNLYIDKECQGKTITITGEIGIDYSSNYQVDDDTFYSWHPELKEKKFDYEFFNGLKDPNDTYFYSILKNGNPLSPNDKLKVGDKLSITQHVYDPNTMVVISKFCDVPLQYNDNGELHLDYTISTDDINYSIDAPEESKLVFTTWGSFIDFSKWTKRVILSKEVQGNGDFTIYNATLDKNGKETLSKINDNTRIVPGNRLKLVANPASGWELDKWNVSGGLLTENNYFVITNPNISISATFATQTNTTLAKKGDADGNGKVNAADATTVLKHVVGIQKLTGTAYSNADVNGDGKVNAADATAILKMVVGIR